MFDWVYEEKVKDHFMNPRNVLENEEDFQEDGKGLVGNIKCGDQMLMLIKVDKKRGVITDCKWKTYGCASAIASTSVLSEMVKGMKLDEAYNLTPKDILRELGSLPEHKIHCSVLGDKALRAAINDYYKRNKMYDKIKEDKEGIVCKCIGVTNSDIENAVLDGVRTYEQLQEYTRLGTVCGKCKEDAIKVMKKYIVDFFGT